MPSEGAGRGWPRRALPGPRQGRRLGNIIVVKIATVVIIVYHYHGHHGHTYYYYVTL